MALTTVGRNHIATLLAAAYANANACIGVGDSTTAFDVAQVDLQAAANKLRKAMDVGYPTLDTNVINFKSTYSTTEANFAWNEWGVFSASSEGIMLSRLVEYNGTKIEGQTWVLEVELSVEIGVEPT